jgi:MFS family permease
VKCCESNTKAIVLSSKIDEAAKPATTPQLFAFFALTFLTTGVLALSFNTAGIVAPVATRALGVGPGAIGPYFTLLSLAAGIGGLFLMGLVRRHGGVRTLQVALVLTLIGHLLAATGNLWLVCLSCLWLGFGGSLLPIATIHLLARMAPPGRAGLVFAINQCGPPIGIGAGGVLIPLLLRHTDWRGVLLVLALVVLAMALALQLVRARADADRSAAAPTQRPNLLAPLKLAWTHPELRSLLPVSIVYMTTMSAGMSYLVSYVNLELDKTLLMAGTALAAAHVASVVARLTLGWILDRVGRHFQVIGALGIGAGISGLLLGGLDRDSSDAVLLSLAALFGAFAFGWTALYFASVARLAPEGQRAAAASGMNLFQMLGALSGPLLFSVLASLTGRMAFGFVVLSLLSLVVGAWLLWSRRHG